MKKTKTFITLFLVIFFSLTGCSKTTQTMKVEIQSALPKFVLRETSGIYLDENGDLYTWGYDQRNSDQETVLLTSLGQGAKVEYNNTPTKIYSNVADIDFMGYAVSKAGELLEWGTLLNGEKFVPQVKKENIAKEYPILFLTQDGKLYSKPEKESIQLTTPYDETYTLVMTDVVDFWYGFGDYALKSDGSIWYFKINSITGEIMQKPEKVIEDVAKMSCGLTENSHQVFLKTDGTLWSMGNNEYGQCGNGEYGDFDNKTQDCVVTTPYKMAENVIDIYTTPTVTFYLTGDNKLYACGLNSNDFMLTGGDGLMDADNAPSFAATPVLVMDDIRQFYQYDAAMYVLKTDNTLWTWGYSGQGVLGNGEFLDAEVLDFNTLLKPLFSGEGIFSQPAQIMEGVEQLLAPTSGLHFLQKKDGSIWYWGNGSIYVDKDDDRDTKVSFGVRLETDDDYSPSGTYYQKFYIIPTPIEFTVDTFYQNALDAIASRGTDTSQYQAAKYYN